MDDPITATAKATEETAKTTGKALDIVHDTGGYFGRVLGDVPADLVGVLGGAWLHERHIRLKARLRARTEEILRERDVQEVIELSPNLAAALVAGAQEESREELMELWARLLANAVDPKLNNLRRSFIEAVKVMDPLDALVLQFLYRSNLSGVHRSQASGDAVTNLMTLARRIDQSPDDVEVSLRHLFSIDFLEHRQVGNDDWYLNANSRQFMRACYPECSSGP